MFKIRQAMFSRVCFFALLTLSVYASKWHQQTEKCINETGVSEEYLFKNGTTHTEDDRTVKCYIASIMKAYGLFNADNSLNFEAAILSIGDDLPEETKQKAIQGIRNCSDTKGEDDCETGYLFSKCVDNYTALE